MNNLTNEAKNFIESNFQTSINIKNNLNQIEIKGDISHLKENSTINDNYNIMSNDSKSHNLKIDFSDKKLTNLFIGLIKKDNFESGLTSESELFFFQLFNNNPDWTKKWINRIFLDFHDESKILVAILHIFSHIDYYSAYPEGQTIAIASLMNKNSEVKEFAIKAFENWENKDSLKYLKEIQSGEVWLQEYIDEVIQDIEGM